LFSSIIVSTDSEQYAEISRRYGAEVPFLRPAELSGDSSPDIAWLEHMFKQLGMQGRRFDCFSILRPTSPFRTYETIQRAWREFMAQDGVDSLRAVERCREHPGKMWVVRGKRMYPLLPIGPAELPWHSTPTQDLPEIYSQNASLEIAWSRVVLEGHTIAGEVIMPFFTEGYEGFDVNRPYDWRLAEELIETKQIILPQIDSSL
jgi:N-acylneuraminate cytidylyltransferase